MSDPNSAEIVVNERGGAQSKVPYRMDLVPPEALLETAEVLAVGAGRYAVNNWRRIPLSDHVNHAIGHLALYMRGDRSENHLAHACCRIMFAIATRDDRFDFRALGEAPMPS